MTEMIRSVTPWSEDSMKNYQWLDEHLHKQPATEKEFQPAWQAHKYLLCGKMYAYIGIDDRNGRPIITLKLEPAFSDMLRCRYEDIVSGYYMNKQHWSTVYLDGNVPQNVLADIVHASYKWVRSSLSKKAQQGILENQLESIAKTYDRAIIEHDKKDSLSYGNLPDYITSNPDYPKYKAAVESGQGGSENTEIQEYLLPDKDKKFIDLGCCLNFMFKGYDQWLSLYHGVDISPQTIQLLNEYITNRKLHVGILFCGSIHEAPFEDNSFHIGACIGVLEYFENDFVRKAIIEAHRIMKPSGRFILDIPYIEGSVGRIMMQIEEYMGRPDKFNMLPEEFENMLQPYFEIEKKDEVNEDTGMINYFLRCKKG